MLTSFPKHFFFQKLKAYEFKSISEKQPKIRSYVHSDGGVSITTVVWAEEIKISLSGSAFWLQTMLLKCSTILRIPEQSKVVSPSSALTILFEVLESLGCGILFYWFLYTNDKGFMLLELNNT